MDLNAATELPVLDRVDVLIVGASTRGVALAEAAARANRRTCIIEPKTYCLSEMGVWHRPWIVWHDEHADLARKWFPIKPTGDAQLPEDGAVLSLVPDQMKIKAEDVLLAEGCTLLYGCLPVSCRRNGLDQEWTVVIGNRSALQIIKAAVVVDASENAVLRRLVGMDPSVLMLPENDDLPISSLSGINHPPIAKLSSHRHESRERQNTQAHIVIEFANIDRHVLPERLSRTDLPACDIGMLPSAFAEDNILLDMTFDRSDDVFAPGGSALDEHAAVELAFYEKAYETARILLHTEPAFQQARLGAVSERVMMRRTFDPVLSLMEGANAWNRIQDEAICCVCWESSSQADWPRHRYPDTVTEEQSKANSAVCCCETNSAVCCCETESAICCCETNSAAWCGEKGSIVWRCENDFNRYHGLSTEGFNMGSLPVLADLDVVVAGGGTSGSVAALAAAEEGASVFLAEMNGALGGTGTLGGIHRYWFGHRTGFTKRLDDLYYAFAESLKYPVEHYVWGTRDTWNPWMKAHVLRRLLSENGVHMLFNSLCVGVITASNESADSKRHDQPDSRRDNDNGNRVVTGLVLATEDGPCVVRAKIVVDATGDGDIAALAGAEVIYGSDHDRLTMWSSLAQYKQAGYTKGGVFSANADISDVLDCTRYLLVNRRRGAACYDHGSYLTTRESRHIKGEYTVDFMDILMFRNFDDVVAIGSSNFDAKGKSDHDAIYMSVLPMQQPFFLPYRAFIPRGLEGLLVTGKAISQTHDAIPITRMQSDLQEQGGMIGIAAARCAKQSIPVRQMDVAGLQATVVKIGSFNQESLEFRLPKGQSFEAIVQALTGKESFYQPDMDVNDEAWSPLPVSRLIAAQPDEVVPFLLKRLREITDDGMAGTGQTTSSGLEHANMVRDQVTEKLPLLMARLLLWHGQEAGLPLVLAHVHKTLSDHDGIPRRSGSLQWSQLYPDQGIMAEISYDMSLLSRSNDPQIVEPFRQLAERLARHSRDYTDRYDCLFSHMDVIARTAEKKGWPAFVPILEQLIQFSEISTEQVIDELDFDINPVRERLAMLKLLLGRALAHCGAESGYLVLASLTGDKRSSIAKSAADALGRLTGQWQGLNKKAWTAVISASPRPLGLISTQPFE